MRFETTSMQLFVVLFVVWILKTQILETYGCVRVEREALLAFKSGVIDPGDCLSYRGFGGEVNPSLLSLSHLKHLDLSMNNFNTSFPNFVTSYKNLRYLNLSFAGFTEAIPPELGNLSTLRYLDLS
ncbi:Receptor-like protein kinase HSL1 [Ananas comosus]|uniref:Receptor-like protein kinase HSL1 n=1 Tax=Ananas comosus TaxID=4615 RepID=A0A199UKS8_ANACO|nr:Receptor-like protein kinase HSL1 [Ananas comosus]